MVTPSWNRTKKLLPPSGQEPENRGLPSRVLDAQERSPRKNWMHVEGVCLVRARPQGEHSHGDTA